MKHTLIELNLPNGAKGLLVHVPNASVMTFEFNFRAGEYLVERKLWETPHIMEHMLLGANELVPKARAFQAEFEKNGAYSNASTGSYDIIYEAECADFEWDRILGLLLTAVTKPLFLEDEFTAEFNNVREELTARSNNHFRHLSLAMREAYGFYVLTDQERIRLMENVGIDDVRKHYERTHTSSNLRFIVAGNLVSTRRRQIEKILSSIELNKGEGRRKLPVETPCRLDRPIYLPNSSVENLYFYIDTFMRKSLKDSELDNLHLINTMLTETLYSRILGTARERGLVYSMSSGISQTYASTNWWFGSQVMPKHIEALFDIVINELQEVFEGKMSGEDIVAAKQYALGRYQRSGQTVGGVASGYSARYFFDEVIDDYYKIPERIEAISKKGIVDISKKMFQENVWGMGVLGNADDEFIQKLNQKLAVLWQYKN